MELQMLAPNMLPVPGEMVSLLFKMQPALLSQVPFHQNTEAISRYIAEDFPVHLAVHQVSPVTAAPAAYTQPHVHEDCHEINLILSTEELVYKIQLGAEEHIVGNNACIWIPKGLVHAANVLYGSGYYIAMRIA